MNSMEEPLMVKNILDSLRAEKVFLGEKGGGGVVSEGVFNLGDYNKNILQRGRGNTLVVHTSPREKIHSLLDQMLWVLGLFLTVLTTMLGICTVLLCLLFV